MKLNYWPYSWGLDVKACPCDVHFVEYLRERGIRDRLIFHFGSGEHHVLGRMNAEQGGPNEILAVTASPREHQAYVDFIIDDPAAAKRYKVMFVDIYTLTPRMLPRFDLVTLFHLGEFHDAQKSSYAPLDDRSLLRLFLSRLSDDGRVFLYSGSFAAAKARPIVEELVSRNEMVFEGEYKSLQIYRRP